MNCVWIIYTQRSRNDGFYFAVTTIVNSFTILFISVTLRINVKAEIFIHMFINLFSNILVSWAVTKRLLYSWPRTNVSLYCLHSAVLLWMLFNTCLNSTAIFDTLLMFLVWSQKTNVVYFQMVISFGTKNYTTNSKVIISVFLKVLLFSQSF